MKIMQHEMTTRLGHWIRTLKEDLYTPCEELQWEVFHTFEHISPADAANGSFQKVRPGYTWGHTWEYGWFHTTFTVPESARGERIVLKLMPGGESTIFVNGEAFGTYRADWVPEDHHYYEDNYLCTSAVPGTTYDILMEVYAGHYFPGAPDTEMVATGPVLPGTFEDPLTEGKRRTLGICTWGIWNETAYQLLMDVTTLSYLLEVTDEKSLRAAKIAEALEKFTLTADFEQDLKARTDSYKEARKVLRPALEAHNGSTMPTFSCIGNAHIDLAWLWPLEETHRKLARTFAAQLRLLDDYPEYKFIQSTPASYEMCKEYYPELFERVLKAAKEGRWIADGAMWVEPDTNMAGGEALIRQLLYGKKYFREVFGIDSQILWLPDTFGYSAVLPQLLKSFGVKYLVTQKIFWSYNDDERFPYHYFRWQGMDGTEITSFLPTNYTYRMDPKELVTVWNERSQARDLDSFLIPFGYGDGGAGPSRDYIEYALREKDLEGVPRVKMVSPQEFFETLDDEGGPKNTYVGELYFTAHRGTYTTQAAVKKGNRKCESVLHEMEFWSAVAWKKGFTYDRKHGEELWKNLLLHQFHDILPGSGIKKIYEETESAHHEILSGAREMTDKALDYLASEGTGTSYTGESCEAISAPIHVGNSLSFSRKELISLPLRFKNGAFTKEGRHYPAYEYGDMVQVLAELPPAGIITLYPELEKHETVTCPVTVTELNGSFVLENSKVRILVNNRAEVTGYILKESGRELAYEPMNVLHLYKDVPGYFDAWDIDSNYIDQELPKAESISVLIEKASGPEAVLTVTGRIGKSSYSQRISLTAESTVLRFEMTVDWKELHRLLKVSFPVNVYAENGINEMQFGFVERPTHRSRRYDKDRFEVCNHRYSALCDGSHGAAVLNDCKYGISMSGNALELTLLRAPSTPEMRADNRLHSFTYGFTAWEGTFTECDVVERGYALNVPPVIWNGCPNGRDLSGSLFTIDAPQVILEALKPSEDGSGDMILRLYESKKTSISTKIKLSENNIRVFECDMQENELDEIKVNEGEFMLSFTPFKIHTIKVRYI